MSNFIRGNIEGQLRLMVIGAHPDDCEIGAGGTAIKFIAQGHMVKFVSLTNGDAGHQSMGGELLARRRWEETLQVAEKFGIEYEVMDTHDAQLQATLENRLMLIKSIRQFAPHIIMTCRPNDYHPDHRNTSLLVQDSMYLISVPNVCPEVPALRYSPIVLYVRDNFQKPCPFDPGVFIPIDEVLEQKIEMMACHVSQFFEWLPWIGNYAGEVPDAPDKRKTWLTRKWSPEFTADPYCDQIFKEFGEIKGCSIKHCEAFEVGEYGAPLDEETRRRIFSRLTS